MFDSVIRDLSADFALTPSHRSYASNNSNRHLSGDEDGRTTDSPMSTGTDREFGEEARRSTSTPKVTVPTKLFEAKRSTHPVRAR